MGNAMNRNNTLGKQLAKLLDWEDAHIGFDTAVANIPTRARSKQPAGLPYSPWQILEHLRLTQKDILDFCLNPNYKGLKWPDDYWPLSQTPSSSEKWHKSILQFRQDRKTFKKMAADPKRDLTALIPHGNGQTYLREITLAADHSAYHIGQLVAVRRLLGVWQSP